MLKTMVKTLFTQVYKRNKETYIANLKDRYIRIANTHMFSFIWKVLFLGGKRKEKSGLQI